MQKGWRYFPVDVSLNKSVDIRHSNSMLCIIPCASLRLKHLSVKRQMAHLSDRVWRALQIDIWRFYWEDKPWNLGVDTISANHLNKHSIYIYIYPFDSISARYHCVWLYIIIWLWYTHLPCSDSTILAVPSPANNERIGLPLAGASPWSGWFRSSWWKRCSLEDHSTYPLENHRKTIGKPLENHRNMVV